MNKFLNKVLFPIDADNLRQRFEQIRFELVR
jgi:hypothetical protein